MLAKFDINARDALALAGEMFAASKFEEAGRLFQAAINIEPGSFEAHHGLGCSLAAVKKYGEALPWIDRAMGIALDKLMTASQAMAVALGEMGRAPEAFHILDGMLTLDPNNAALHYNRAIMLMQMNRFEDAIDEFEVVLKLDPSVNSDFGSATYGRGFSNLVLGNYADGFRDFEHRLKLPLPEALAKVEQWTGQDLDGKSIAVLGEMGSGDNIMFARYLALMMAKWDVRISCFMPKGLPQAFAGMPGVEFFTTYTALDHLRPDYWVRIMSLGWCFKTTKATIPPPAPLRFDDQLLAKWRWFRGMGNQPHGDNRFRVGLCWAGSPKSKYDEHRTIPLRLLEPLIALKKRHPRLRFYGLQQDIREVDHAAAAVLDIEHIGEQFANFADTAHALKCLDLVITCDTSVAHMAGTVGVPTWVLLTTFRTYWLWVKGETRTAWYPSMTCFRQDTDGDWPGVVARVTGELETLMSR